MAQKSSSRLAAIHDLGAMDVAVRRQDQHADRGAHRAAAHRADRVDSERVLMLAVNSRFETGITRDEAIAPIR
jgi:hypothetical protein